MRRFVVLLTVAALLVGVPASTARAEPSDVKIIVGSKAQFLTSLTLQVPVTYVCPATFVTAFIQVLVSQAETGQQGQAVTFMAPCTDEPETIVLTVTAFFPTRSFALGQAIATGFINAGLQTDTHTRRIQIVL